MSSPKRLRHSFENILIAVIFALLVRTFLITGYRVPTSSMAPTLLPGDFIFAFRPAGGFKIPLTSTKLAVPEPTRGELVVFTFTEQPHTNYIKRIIGVAGDKIQMRQGQLILNDVPATYVKQDQSSLLDLPGYDRLEVWTETVADQSRQVVRRLNETGEDFGPLIVPPREVFVLGDHRDASDDSRYWGTVPIDRIDGRVLMIWLSLDWEKRWGDNRFPMLRGDRLLTFVH